MKLYTQDQVLKMLEVCRDSDLYEHILTFEDILKTETPIELPSDEEIEERYYKELEDRREKAKNFTGQVAGRHPDMFGVSEMHNMVTGYLECLKWMRNKIQGGNK